MVDNLYRYLALLLTFLLITSMNAQAQMNSTGISQLEISSSQITADSLSEVDNDSLDFTASDTTANTQEEPPTFFGSITRPLILTALAGGLLLLLFTQRGR
ncbi:hypothetical protein CEE37_06925 [candidate division LCP-89 bacterium B3_LCP]|uniref:Gram-positive cocci surface proteins LPxTG domain-containing protein n=1 Tax=candidate division LCP-89 bacterium B3_LCP TaxID=2012998 RepID=A0A532V0F1_UNCL8|nr:MAG: hypothetical protein CEE37_06925 [candidate division LCP-89 bacterium B3_LCP]